MFHLLFAQVLLFHCTKTAEHHGTLNSPL